MNIKYSAGASEQSDDSYELALIEFESKKPNRPVLAKAIANSGGNDNKVQSLYVTYRAEQIRQMRNKEHASLLVRRTKNMVSSSIEAVSRIPQNGNQMIKEEVESEGFLTLCVQIIVYLVMAPAIGILFTVGGWFALTENMCENTPTC